MKRQIAAILTATVIPLAACTTANGTDPVPPPESTSGVSASLASTSVSTTIGSVDSSLSSSTKTGTPPAGTPRDSASTSAASTSSAATGDIYDAISVEVPATVTGLALAAANAAIPVWRNAVRLYDESMQSPSDNWTAEIRKYVADPAAVTQLSLVAAFAQDGMHQIGDTRYDAKVIDADPHNVQIRACVDVSRVDVVNADGASITGGSAKRFLWEFNLDFYPNDAHHWLLNLVTKPNPTKPC